MTQMQHWLLFGSVMVAAWFFFTYFWPRMLLSVFKRAILAKECELNNSPMCDFCIR